MNIPPMQRPQTVTVAARGDASGGQGFTGDEFSLLPVVSAQVYLGAPLCQGHPHLLRVYM